MLFWLIIIEVRKLRFDPCVWIRRLDSVLGYALSSVEAILVLWKSGGGSTHILIPSEFNVKLIPLNLKFA